jgi:hypothetical protein
MLFERFVFVLYLLFVYAWFLLGALYDNDLRFVPLLSMLLTLFSVTVVTMFQLQRIVRRGAMDQADRWSTLAWSAVHILMCILFLMDSFEWVNVLVVLSVAGLVLTVMIMVVGVCSCYVIILNGRDWAPHIHLTCICFWVLVQYMSVRLPLDGLQYVTTVPVVAMAGLRVYEHVEDGVDRWSALELCLWCACIIFHIFLDVGLWSPHTFYWCLLAVICVMTLMSRHVSKLMTLCAMPFVLMPLAMYTCFRCAQGYRSVDIFGEISNLYDELTAAKPMEPFEIEMIEEDFDTRL